LNEPVETMACLARSATEVADPHSGADFRPAGLALNCAGIRLEIEPNRLVFIFHQIATGAHGANPAQMAPLK
jgi:hypothetical protein